ncbi:MAG TPA: high-potential iron-sulfur protein [Rhodanobacteraceae bacterium]|nr:high-potential iron-sulfur protein [Rhodanobacteraceae bacterium]
MHHPADSQARRRFLKLAAASVVAAPIAATLLPRFARADDLPHLSESDPTAQALGYKEDASKVDKAKFAVYKPGSLCENCKFWTGKQGDAYGPCGLFPGKATNAKGWCSGYNPKA